MARCGYRWRCSPIFWFLLEKSTDVVLLEVILQHYLFEPLDGAAGDIERLLPIVHLRVLTRDRRLVPVPFELVEILIMLGFAGLLEAAQVVEHSGSSTPVNPNPVLRTHVLKVFAGLRLPFLNRVLLQI